MTTGVLEHRAVSLRPIALPTEHGGWGFLLEPIALGLLVAPSSSGVWIALAAAFGFLTRQPLRLALQDAVRRRVYPRTRYCWLLAGAYGIAAAASLAGATIIGGTPLLMPLAVAAPFGAIQIFYDARNRSRHLIAELGGAVAMCSVAAAIGIAGGMDWLPALGLSGIMVARAVPSILYVRAMLRAGRAAPAVATHVAALAVVAMYGSLYAGVAMFVLLLRAIYGLTRVPPPAKTIGWREIVFGVMTVALAAA